MNRRGFLTAVGAPAVLRSALGQGRGGSRPNILFAIADDQSWPGAIPLDEGTMRLPAAARVASEGVAFTHSYCAAPSCTPSRTAVLTGRHIWQAGEGGVLYGTLEPRYPLFTHLLEDAGYATGFTGKGWGPGDWQAGGLKRHPIGREFNERRMAAGSTAPGIDVRDYAANFDDFLSARKAGQPFFFWYGGTEPHRVYDRGIGARLGKRLDAVRKVPAFWPDNETLRGDILDYCAECEWFDRHLGRMLESLERAGELDNTMVVVTSDNGMPFPRAKVNLYDWGVRMPLAIRWGSRVAGGGRRSEDFVSHVDFAPTFLEAAGVRAPRGMAGRSLLGALRRPDASRDCALTALERHTMCRPDGATYPIRGLRTRRFLYLRNFEPERWPTGGPEFVSSNKTFHGDVDACPAKDFMTDAANQRRYSGEYELCFGKRPGEELYDLDADPWQVKNVAGEANYRAEKKALRARLEAELRATGDPRMEGRDPWQGYVYRQTIGYGASFNRSLPEAVRRMAREAATHKPE